MGKDQKRKRKREKRERQRQSKTTSTPTTDINDDQASTTVKKNSTTSGSTIHSHMNSKHYDTAVPSNRDTTSTNDVVRCSNGIRATLQTTTAHSEQYQQQQGISTTDDYDGNATNLSLLPPPLDSNCLDRKEDDGDGDNDRPTQQLLLDLARITLAPRRKDQQKKHHKRRRLTTTTTDDCSVTPQHPKKKPTPIQLHIWSLHLHHRQTPPSSSSSSSSSSSHIDDGVVGGKDNRCHHHHPNVIGIAPTGSGKTLCYAIPLIHSLLLQQQQRGGGEEGGIGEEAQGGVQALIIVPTRELAGQVRKEVQRVIKASRRLKRERKKREDGDEDDDGRVVIDALAIYGGVARREQYDTLLSTEVCGNGDDDDDGEKNKKYWIVVATTGRLLDLLTDKDNDDDDNDDAQRRKSERFRNKFRNVKHVVIDEADRVAGNTEMATQVDQILSQINHRRRHRKSTMSMSLYSATMPQNIWIKWNEWIGFPRVLIEVDSMTLGSRSIQNSSSSSNGEVEKSVVRVGCGSDGKGGDEKNDKHDGPNAMTKSSNSNDDPQQANHDGNDIQATTTTSTTTGKTTTTTDQHQTSKEGRQRKHTEKTTLNLSTIPSHIIQTLHVCSNHKKPKKLLATMAKICECDRNSNSNSRNRNRSLTLVFFNRIKTLQYIHSLLRKQVQPPLSSSSSSSSTTTKTTQGGRGGSPATPSSNNNYHRNNHNQYGTIGTLHGNMDQSQRDLALFNFRSGKTPILLTTDIAARGLHVKNIAFVVNYDFPCSLEQYVHRCGRAGRRDITHTDESEGTQCSNKTNNSPTVYSFFNRELAPMAQDIFEILQSCNAWIDPNLVALIGNSGGNIAECEYNNGKTKRRRRRGGANGGGNGRTDDYKTKTITTAPLSYCGKTNATPENLEEEEEDIEFASLGTKRIVLHRASHVSDAESDTDSD